MRMSYYFNVSDYIRFFVKVLITTNVNVSSELHFSNVYQSVNYTANQCSLTLHATRCSLQLDKAQKNEIQDSNEYSFENHTFPS